MSDKVVLAYSGGLDTSIIIPWLRETYGLEEYEVDAATTVASAATAAVGGSELVTEKLPAALASSRLLPQQTFRNTAVAGGIVGAGSGIVSGGVRGLADNKTFGNVNFLGGSDALSDAFMQDSEMLARIDECSGNDDACWDELRALIESTAGVQ